jgi:hypothetical protein
MNTRIKNQKPTHVVACAMGQAVNEEDRKVVASMCVRPDQAALAAVVLGIVSPTIRMHPLRIPGGLGKVAK